MSPLHPMLFDDSLLFLPLSVSFASLINSLRLRNRKTICCPANKEKKILNTRKIKKKKRKKKPTEKQTNEK